MRGLSRQAPLHRARVAPSYELPGLPDMSTLVAWHPMADSSPLSCRRFSLAGLAVRHDE